MTEQEQQQDVDLKDIPIEEDYPRSAWDISTDYGPRKTWAELGEELRQAAREARARR